VRSSFHAIGRDRKILKEVMVIDQPSLKERNFSEKGVAGSGVRG